VRAVHREHSVSFTSSVSICSTNIIWFDLLLQFWFAMVCLVLYQNINCCPKPFKNVLKRAADSKYVDAYADDWQHGRLGLDGTSGFFCAFLRSGFPFSISKLILKRGRRNQKRALDCSRGPGKVNLNDLETLWCGSQQTKQKKNVTIGHIGSQLAVWCFISLKLNHELMIYLVM